MATSKGPAGMSLGELARELPMPSRTEGDVSVRVTGVRHDSRSVLPGDIFVARRGTHADGTRFVPDAVARGASAILAAPGTIDAGGVGVPVLFAADPAVALAYAASAIYGHPSFSLDVVGVTGTNGKTSTVHLVRAAIDGALGVPSTGVLGTVGNGFAGWQVAAEHTTPEADEVARVMARMRALGATHVAMEVSSHALSLGRVQALRFRVAAFTNLTQDHLDFHGSMEGYGEAKATLFRELGPGSAVINVGDPFGRSLAARVTSPLVRVTGRPGAAAMEADIAPREVTLDARGIHAIVRTPAGDVEMQSRLVGAHNLENLLVALGVAHALELDLERAARGLSREAGAPGRLERCDAPDDDVVVLVDYAHTPDALARVLDAVRTTTGGRLWCVFGCGGDRDPTKRGPMGRAVGARADVAIVTSDNPRGEDPVLVAAAAAGGVRDAGLEPLVELDRARAIACAILSAAPGDAVVIAGKGHEDYQIVGRARLPFDDRREARHALGLRRTGGGRT
jgi:UDP-N-acetylmuramoyl-L-alanyl-D-glutamate--2,6-diaminopimelate ligase